MLPPGTTQQGSACVGAASLCSPGAQPVPAGSLQAREPGRAAPPGGLGAVWHVALGTWGGHPGGAATLTAWLHLSYAVILPEGEGDGRRGIQLHCECHGWGWGGHSPGIRKTGGAPSLPASQSPKNVLGLSGCQVGQANNLGEAWGLGQALIPGDLGLSPRLTPRLPFLPPPPAPTM